MDLSIKRREIKAVETKIKDHLMMAGMSSVWKDAERIRKESERAHLQYLKDIHKKRKERQRKMKERFTAMFIVCSLVFIGWAGCAVVGFSTAAPAITPSSGLMVADGPDECFVFFEVFFVSAIGRSTLQGLRNSLHYAFTLHIYLTRALLNLMTGQHASRFTTHLIPHHADGE